MPMTPYKPYAGAVKGSQAGQAYMATLPQYSPNDRARMRATMGNSNRANTNAAALGITQRYRGNIDSPGAIQAMARMQGASASGLAGTIADESRMDLENRQRMGEMDRRYGLDADAARRSQERHQLDMMREREEYARSMADRARMNDPEQAEMERLMQLYEMAPGTSKVNSALFDRMFSKYMGGAGTPRFGRTPQTSMMFS